MGLEPMTPSSTQEKKAPVELEKIGAHWNNICASIHTHISTSRPHKNMQGVNILVLQDHTNTYKE